MKSSRLTYKGTCQICGAIVTASGDKKHTLNSHLSTRSWSFLNGTCSGSQLSAFEVSCESVAGEIVRVKKEADSFYEQAKTITSDTSTTVMRFDCSLEPPREVEFVLTQANKHIWSYETRCTDLKDAVAQYNFQRAYPLQQAAIERDAYCNWQKQRLQGWNPSQILTTQDKDKIGDANKARTAAIRDAKRTTKSNSDTVGAAYYEHSVDLDNTDWITNEIADQRQTAIAIATKVYSLGTRGINCQTWLDHKPVKEQVHSLREFCSLYERSDGGFRVECANCRALLSLRFGEVCCDKHDGAWYTWESTQIVEMLTMISRTLRRGDALVHLHTSSNRAGSRWHDITQWKEGFLLLTEPRATSSDLYCSTCKSQIILKNADILCECEKPFEEEQHAAERSTATKALELGASVLGSLFRRSEKLEGSTAYRLDKPIDITDQFLSTTQLESSEHNEIDIMAMTNLEPQLDLLQIAPDTQDAFDNWLRTFGSCTS